MTPRSPKCRGCVDTFWVCDAHPDLPSDIGASPRACKCGAPGMPCPDCNPYGSPMNLRRCRRGSLLTTVRGTEGRLGECRSWRMELRIKISVVNARKGVAAPDSFRRKPPKRIQASIDPLSIEAFHTRSTESKPPLRVQPVSISLRSASDKEGCSSCWAAQPS